MDDGFEVKAPQPLTRKERADAVAKALGEAARRARLSKKHRAHLPTNYVGVRRRSQSARIVKIASFIVLVALPSLAVATYYLFIASDQFTSQARFTVRGGLPPKLDTIGALTGLPSVLVMQDTQVILNFILSRDMIQDLDAKVGLRALYGRPSIDPISRLKPDATIERIVKYWSSMVDFSVRMPAGIVTLTVRAFRPEDARRIADAALAACENLVNDMNEKMIRDTLAVSEMERQRAQDNLAIARGQLESARNAEGVLSPEKTAEALDGLVAKIRGELADLNQQYEANRHYVTADTPQMRYLNIRIEAANQALKQLQAHLTQSDGEGGVRPLSGTMSRLSYLSLENTVAEKIYASALVLLEHAQLAADSKLLSLNVSVQPAVAEEALYPRRFLDSLIFATLDFCVWGLIIVLANFASRRLRTYLGARMRVKA